MTLASVRSGGKRALAAALARIETGIETPGVADLLDDALGAQHGVAIGLTGPPGVGKSTLMDALIRQWRTEGRTVAALAVDPSSKSSGGALLGDRTRLTRDPADAGVFVRSMAARDRLGGLAEGSFPAVVLLRALFDIVLVETVGVGQSETAIADEADLVVLCTQPGAGDSLQFMKAGVMEIPDLILVTKADMGGVADRAVAHLKGALSLSDADPPVMACSAVTGSGVVDVATWLGTASARIRPHSLTLSGTQANRWLEAQVRAKFGTEGLSLTRQDSRGLCQNAPFSHSVALMSRLSRALDAAFR